MQYRTLGNTGLRISRLGFGGIPIQKTDREQTRRLMHALIENGINYIDTARGDTVSEEYLGYGLEGIRDQFILATKSRTCTREGMEKKASDCIGCGVCETRCPYQLSIRQMMQAAAETFGE